MGWSQPLGEAVQGQGGPRYGATGHSQLPESLHISRKTKSRGTDHLDIEDMNQTAVSRAKKIRSFLCVGFGLVLVSTTLVLVLVLNGGEGAEETKDYEQYKRTAIWGWSYGGFATAMT